MIWVIYLIWSIFVFTLAFLAEKRQKDIYGFILIISMVLMFYIPFMV